MIVPDVNLLVYAYNERAPAHEAARAWWEELLRREQSVGLPWAVVMGYVRLMTHPAVRESPLAPGTALHDVRLWLERAHVRILEPGPRHLEIVEQLLDAAGVAANLTTDAHLAALAVEYQGELHSNDTDFARFPGLRWHDPVSSAPVSS